MSCQSVNIVMAVELFLGLVQEEVYAFLMAAPSITFFFPKAASSSSKTCQRSQCRWTPLIWAVLQCTECPSALCCIQFQDPMLRFQILYWSVAWSCKDLDQDTLWCCTPKMLIPMPLIYIRVFMHVEDDIFCLMIQCFFASHPQSRTSSLDLAVSQGYFILYSNPEWLISSFWHERKLRSSIQAEEAMQSLLLECTVCHCQNRGTRRSSPFRPEDAVNQAHPQPCQH